MREFGKQPFSTPKLFGGFTLPLSTAGRVGPLAPPRVRSISLDFKGLMASKPITAVNALTGEQPVQARGRAVLQELAGRWPGPPAPQLDRLPEREGAAKTRPPKRVSGCFRGGSVA